MAFAEWSFSNALPNESFSRPKVESGIFVVSLMNSSTKNKFFLSHEKPQYSSHVSAHENLSINRAGSSRHSGEVIIFSIIGSYLAKVNSQNLIL